MKLHALEEMLLKMLLKMWVVASCEAVSESLSPMAISLGTISNNNNNNTCIHNVLCVIVYKQVYKQKK